MSELVRGAVVGSCPSRLTASVEEVVEALFPCSRPAGHDGDHESYSENGILLAWWSEQSQGGLGHG